MRRAALLLCLFVAASCGGAEHHAAAPSPTPSPLPTLPPAPIAAYCSIPVNGVGTLAMETDYLPHVVQCENGGAGPESLAAQAVAARTYAYYKLETSGSVSNGTGDQVYSCGGTPNADQIAAVQRTAGQVLVYGGDVIASFFVAGAKPSNHASCVAVAGDSDSTNTEKYVTYNDGLSGNAITQTTLGFVDPQNARNRGCLSQWGTRCLEGAGHDFTSMMTFYYGADIVRAQAHGPCVDGTAVAEPPRAFRPPMPGDSWPASMRIGKDR